jgi:hypothetical protein
MSSEKTVISTPVEQSSTSGVGSVTSVSQSVSSIHTSKSATSKIGASSSYFDHLLPLDVSVSDTCCTCWSRIIVTIAVSAAIRVAIAIPIREWWEYVTLWILNINIFTKLIVDTPVDHRPGTNDLVASIWYYVEVGIFISCSDQLTIIEVDQRLTEFWQFAIFAVAVTIFWEFNYPVRYMLDRDRLRTGTLGKLPLGSSAVQVHE